MVTQQTGCLIIHLSVVSVFPTVMHSKLLGIVESSILTLSHSMLQKTQQLQSTYLYVFSLCLIVEDVCNLLSKDLLSAGSSMDTHHGYTNGPGGIAYGHLQVDSISLRVRGRGEKLKNASYTLHMV